ncbi:MAG: ferredoxin--NADP reductase [bacterium]|nr:3-ketosteroid-9-alpha-hydroxylase [Deltaproteobacteria bacterium]MCP4907690.1 ferredoxin--NADP reductase [bacterium]
MSAEDGAASSTEASGPYYHLRVADVIVETADSKSIVLEVPAEFAERFSYEAGQFLSFRVEVAGHRLVRCYSLASAPGLDAGHKVTVKRVVDGRASNWMNDEVSAGDELEVMPPAGVFVLRESDQPLVLFSGGSGITPCISILKTALATTSRQIKLLYANRDDRSIIFKDELNAMLSLHADRLEIVHRLDDVHGFCDAALIVQEIGPRTDADFYICGPGPFMDVVETGLESLSVPSDQIHIERFESLDSPSAAASAPVDTADGQVVTIVLDGDETDVVAAEGETILAAARRTGLEPPFACEEAYCGCCMAKVVEGEVTMKMNDGGIDQRQIDEGWVLTCQGLVKGKVRVEYPD